MVKLDLGCGANKKEGYTGVDKAQIEGVDVVWDLRVSPWPFENESVDEVRCSHFFEHLTGEERILFMNELQRILKVGGKAEVICPYYSSMRAVQDPTHKWPPVCEASFLYFNKEWRDQNHLSHYGIEADFDFTYGYVLAPELQMRADEYRNFAFGHYLNSITDCQINLTKRGA